jgi:competence ComEA-like helix-hairpin-helix protein
MKWQEFVKDYLSFTRRERIGVLVITALILLTLFIPKIVSVTTQRKTVAPDTAWFTAVKKLEQNSIDSFNRDYQKNQDDDDNYAYQYDRTKSNYSGSENIKGELFYFDPNILNEEGWKRLGLRDKTIQTIQNYLSKGGKFRKPEDLKRIYGLRENEYNRLASYVKIESVAETKNESPPAKTFTSRYSIIDINAADTTGFISLPGIGSKLAARIVNFRDKLGGFYSIEQVKETFGLPDSTYQKIKQYLSLNNPQVKKININKATVDELKAHPYIKYSLANPIVAYRNEHGPYSKVEDIKKVMVVTEEIYNKIALYLSVQ